MLYPYGETVVLIHRTASGRDADGNDALTESGRDTFTGVPVAPGDSNGSGGNENTSAREQVFIGLTVYLPAGAVVAATDQVIARGATWDVYGAPGQWVSPFSGWAPGMPVSLVRVTG